MKDLKVGFINSSFFSNPGGITKLLTTQKNVLDEFQNSKAIIENLQALKFDVPNGNVIKFAVNLKFDEFIIDLCQWKVDFNKVKDCQRHPLFYNDEDLKPGSRNLSSLRKL